jgi:hypothetical protein
MLVNVRVYRLRAEEDHIGPIADEFQDLVVDACERERFAHGEFSQRK